MIRNRMASAEESFVVSKSNKSDAWFDRTIGYIEDIIMEDEFQTLQNDFLEKYYHEFEDTEENKFIYTDIHKEYTQLIEKYICEQLTKLMSDFSMDEFQKQLIARKDDLEGEIFEMLVTFSDFLAFKEMMLDYKAEKEGRTIDLSAGLTVTSLSGSSNGFGLAGTSLSIQGSMSNCNTMDLMEPEDMVMEENGADQVNEENQEESNRTTKVSSLTNKPTAQMTDVTMESPR